MKKIKAFLYSRAKQSLPFLVKLFGANLLDKSATLAKLNSYKIFAEASTAIVMPPAGGIGYLLPDSFSNPQLVSTSSVNVYRINNTNSIKIYPYGGVKFNRDVLDLDFGSSLFIKTLLKRDNRPIIKTETCIVLWSHEWGTGYYDYTYFIYAKLLRIKSVMTEADFKQAKIVYPLINTGFEKELMQYAGVSDGQLIDSKTHNVTAHTYYLANNDSWYYHNQRDLSVLKNALASVKTPVITAERIYIQRKARRRLTNEDAVITLLKEFNFTIVEDIPRTVADQIALYKAAKVIIGPHGASYTNLVGCNACTILIELFPKNYYPDYFRYLSAAFGLSYFAIFEDGIQDSHYRNLDEDITIDIAKIKNALGQILT